MHTSTGPACLAPRVHPPRTDNFPATMLAAARMPPMPSMPQGATIAPRVAHPSSSANQRQLAQPAAAPLKRSTSKLLDRPRPHQRSTSPPPVPAQAAAPPPADPPKPKTAKLTEQWGEPPTVIRRETDSLTRGDMLGEVRCMRHLRWRAAGGGLVRVQLTQLLRARREGSRGCTLRQSPAERRRRSKSFPRSSSSRPRTRARCVRSRRQR